MKKSHKFPEELYILEIETWRKSSQLHAENAIIQYKRVTEGLEDIYFEKKRNEAILSSLNDGIIVIDEDNKIIIFNKTSANILNITAKSALKKDFDGFFEGCYPALLTFVRKQKIINKSKRKKYLIALHNALFINCHYDVISITDKKYGILLLEDSSDLILAQQALKQEKHFLEKRVEERTIDLQTEITKKEQAKKRAEQISFTDALTKLPNRRAFTETLEKTVNNYKQGSKRPFSLLFIDLDGFKTINDTLGHYAGDVVLIEISKRMKSIIRNNDFCSRLGGDEFVIMLDNLNTQTHVINVVEKLLNNLSQAIAYNNNQTMSVTASIGVYLHTNDETNSSTILTMSDEAMYEAKKRGKNRYVLFDKALQEKLENKTQLVQLLDVAFTKNEFIVYYQPICNVNGEIVGAEALARWQHQGEFISPARFIPLLEQHGKIKEFTRFVIEQVFLNLLLHEQFPCISVNLSMQEFYDDSFIDYVDETFAHMPELKRRISFEITESLFHNDQQALSKGINALRARGFRVYIDDFGTGYSSFSYIRNFKADVIKIDREFVIDIENDEQKANLLKGMVALLTSMDMEVIIEGIENKGQIKQIKSFSETVKIQGFYFYKPMPFTDILKVLA